MSLVDLVKEWKRFTHNWSSVWVKIIKTINLVKIEAFIKQIAKLIFHHEWGIKRLAISGKVLALQKIVGIKCFKVIDSPATAGQDLITFPC